ncbi:glycosyltransferase family 2 protein [Desulfatitalea tepidiphila]|uniref:glycosyltransferase family 2 protein n=1 Tax=Desulfatitalea tepidiphila TaxID=1185843 RepID=UPI00350E5862
MTIGLPVYNGAEFLHQASEALLAQDYRNFELIISDNASIDGTELICNELSARDSRISFCRNKTNFVPSANFRRVYDLARGQYFMWA